VKLTPDNIQPLLTDLYGAPWQDALRPGEDPESFATQLRLLDAVQCPRCDDWHEDGDLVTTDAHADAWCGPCWGAEADDAETMAYHEHCNDGVRAAYERTAR
jgi:hypothetical protein